MKTNKFKRAIVMLLAITMLLTSTGMASFAESMGEGADKVSTEAVVTESGSDAVQAAAEEAAAEINDEEVPEAAPAEKAEAVLTAKDWEAGLPDKISKDVREAMAQVAKSQLKAEGDLYKAFANAESLDNWDASFVMFVLEYANVLGVSKAIGDESKGTVDKDDISVPVNADTDKWIKALKDKDLFTEISDEAAPEQGDIVFTEDGAAVVIDAEDLTVIGAHNNNVEKFKADADKVSGFVSLEDIAPAEFKDEEQAEEPAEEADEEATEAEELTEEELAAKKAEEEAAAKAAEEAAKAEEAARRIEEENLTEQTVDAELTAAPGIGGKLRSLFTSENGTEIKLSGYLPEDATVKAYPVNVEIPGQNVLAAYDITIYVKDADGNDVEWQPAEPLNVSITSEKLENAKAVSIYHMDNKDTDAEFVEDKLARSGNVKFDAESFSVYVVTETKPHIIYKFLNSGTGMEGEEYIELRQSLYDGQSLVRPVDPTDHGRKFVKWVAVSSADQTVSSDDEGFEDWGEKHVDESAVDPDTKSEIRLLKAVFETAPQLRIKYHDQNGSVIRQDIITAGDSIDPNGTKDASKKVRYTAMQMNENEYLTFVYWTEDLYRLGTEDPFKDVPFEYGKDESGASQTEIPTADLDLYPFCSPAHWLYFDGNKAVSEEDKLSRPGSVPYTGSELILEGMIPAEVGHPEGVTGYEFAGWYVDRAGDRKVFGPSGKPVDMSGNELTWDADNNVFKTSDNQTVEKSDTAFAKYLYTGGASLEYDPTLYAHWTPTGNSSYTVAYYVQNASDAVGLSDTNKTYTYYAMGREGQSVSASSGSTVGYTTEDAVASVASLTDSSKPLYGLDPNGLELNENKSESVTVKPDGKTVLYVYYDRKEFTMTFWSGIKESTSGQSVNWAAYNPNSWLSGNGANQYTAKKLTTLYGHDLSANHSDGKGWPINRNNTYQWIDIEGSHDDSVSSGRSTTNNEVLMMYMPARNRNYTDEFLNTGYTYTRNFYIEKVNSTNSSDYSGYELHNDWYKDVRTSSSGQGNFSITVKVAPKIDGFHIVRLDGRNSTGNGVNYQWATDGDHATLSGNAVITGAGQTEATIRYYGTSGSNNNYYADLYYARNTHKLTLRYRLDGSVLTEKKEFATTRFGTELKGILEENDYASNRDNIINVKNEKNSWWFYDEACTVPVDPEAIEDGTLKMPDYDLVLYEGMKTSYPVVIDPNGGVLDGQNGSTWFNLDKGEMIQEYTATRDYELASELDDVDLEPGQGYFYRYADTHTDPTEIYGSAPRTAAYVEAAESETGDYAYYPGVWTFQYWYKVSNVTFDSATKKFTAISEAPGDSDKAYDFTSEVTGPIVLRAKWLREGAFNMVYDASAKLDGNNLTARAPHDSAEYAEGSSAVIKSSADNPKGYQFRFWALTPQNNRNISAIAEEDRLYPNKKMTVTHTLADSNDNITLYAWYEKGEFTENHIAEYKFYIPKAATEDDYDFKITDSDGTRYYKYMDADPATPETYAAGDANIPYYLETISPGEQLIAPRTPADPDTGRNGAFTGWFTDKALTERFDGFGNVGTPRDTKLYAGFARIYTVTYLDEDKSGTVTVQTYRDGDILSTLEAQYPTSNGKYVAYWTDYEGSGEAPANKQYPYNGKKGYFGSDYTGDLTLHPIIKDEYVMRFDSQGGSYVAPITFPHSEKRWTHAPAEPTLRGYDFAGWWTEQNYSGKVGESDRVDAGVKYEFDQPLADWMDDNGLTEKPEVLYAHWSRNNDILTTYVAVNYWIQDTSRSGYILWDSERINDLVVGSSFTLPTGSSADSYSSTDKIKGYYTFTGDDDGDPDDANDDRRYFKEGTVRNRIKPVSGDEVVADGATATVQDNGGTAFDVYFDRKTYTLKFNPQKNITVNQLINFIFHNGIGKWDYYSEYSTNVNYYYNGKINGTAYNSTNPYEMTVWLGKDVTEEWPNNVDLSDQYCNYAYDNNKTYYFSVFRNKNKVKTGKVYDEESYLRNYYVFNSWKSANTSVLNYDSPAMQSYIGRNLIPSNGETEGASATLDIDLIKYHEDGDAFTVDEFGSSVYNGTRNLPAEKPSATVHYFIPLSYNNNGTVNEWTELTNLQQTVSDVKGSGTGNSWKPTTDELNDRILAQKLTIAGYKYDDTWNSEQKSGTVPVTLYKYRMPDSGYWGQYRFYRKFGEIGAFIYERLRVNQKSEWVEKGDFTLVYRTDSLQRDGDPTYYTEAANTPVAWNVTGMSTAELRRIITENYYESIDTTKTVSGNHVNLYYIPQQEYLTLRSAEDESWQPEKVLARYGEYLTNETGTSGFIHDTAKINPPSIVGKEFSNWSVSRESSSPFEGTMPDYPLTLYAHYVDATVTVTLQGVDGSGVVKRKAYTDASGNVRNALDKEDPDDIKQVLHSWGDDATHKDRAIDKVYNTRLREFELPTPVLEENEIFYGWKRVVTIGHGDSATQALAHGYVSSNTQITEDTILVPDIRYNKGGKVHYEANGGTGNTPADAGGFFLGGSVKAAEGSTLTKTKGNVTLPFLCWNTEENGTGIDYYPGDTVHLPDSGILTLYARYSDTRNYKLVYHLNNTDASGTEFKAKNASDTLVGTSGSGCNSIITVEFPEYDNSSNYNEYPNSKYPAAQDKEKHEFTALRAGYHLLGWNSLAAGGEETRIFSTDIIRVNSIDADSDNAIHIYAEWEQDRIPVKAFKEVFDGDPVEVTNSAGDMTTDALHTWTSAQFETAYRAVKTYADPVAANYSFRNVVVKNTETSAETEAAMVRYALNSDGLGYVWQYKAVGASDNDYTTLTDKDVIELRYAATYSLTIDNVVDMTGAYSSTSDKFDIAVTLTHANGDPVTEQEAIAAGITYKSKIDGAASEETAVDASASVITVTLQHNGQAIIDNVPAGWKYSIVETKDNGYTVSYAASATGQLSGNTTVTITNKRDTIVPSGIEKSNSILIPLFLTLLLALGVILSIIQRRRLASRTR